MGLASVTYDQNIAYLTVIVVAIGLCHQTVAGVGVGIIPEASHIDPGVVLVCVGTPVPLGTPLFIHRNATGQQDLGTKILTVAAGSVIGFPVAVALDTVCIHILVSGLSVIIVIPRFAYGSTGAATGRLSGRDIAQQRVQLLVAATGRIVAELGIGRIVAGMVLNEPGVLSRAAKHKCMRHAQFLAGHMRRGGKSLHGIFRYADLYLFLTAPLHACAAQLEVITHQMQVDQRRLAQLDHAVPNGLVPVRFRLCAKELRTVLHRQITQGAIVAVHHVQHHLLHAGRQTLGGSAANALLFGCHRFQRLVLRRRRLRLLRRFIFLLYYNVFTG